MLFLQKKRSRLSKRNLFLKLFIFRSRNIRGVEHFVSLVTAGLAEELGVETLDSLALMRLAQGHILVRLVESGGSARSEVDEVAHDCVLYRLTAAVDAAAGAAHDLDEVIVGSAVLDLLHNRVGVCKSADYAALDFHAVDGASQRRFSAPLP